MLILLACTGSTDPQLEPVRQSLAAYEAGTRALEAGDPKAAQGHFEAAIAVDTESATLQLWRAKALADQGDFEGAVEGATEALKRQPELLEARYDRACWRSRAGDQEGAAEDLRIALRDPVLDPLVVARDPDLEALRDSPFGEVVPRPVLPVHAELSEEAVFLGGEVVLRLAALHPGQLSLVHEGPEAGILALRKVVEDQTPEGSQTRTELRFSWTVLGAGEVPLGPWRVEAEGFEGRTEGGVVRALAPEGHQPAQEDGLADDWVLPSSLGSPQGQPGDPTPEGATVTYELRKRGQPVALWWRQAPPAH